MGGKNRVVWFDNRGGNLRRWVYTELQLALLAVVDGQSLHQQGSEAGTSSTTERVEYEETLQTGAVIGNATNFVQNLINELLSDCVVATGIIV